VYDFKDPRYYFRMQKLVVKGGDRAYPALPGITIGRKAGNTIQVEGPGVDDWHAKVVKLGAQLFVETLQDGSTISINGKKTTRSTLKKGDQVQFGNTVLLFDEDDQPEPAAKTPLPPSKKPETSSGSGKSKVVSAVGMPKVTIPPNTGESKTQDHISASKIPVASKASTSGVRPAASPASSSSSAKLSIPPVTGEKSSSSSAKLQIPPTAPGASGSGVRPAAKPSSAASSQQIQIPPAIQEKGAGSSTRLQLPPAVPSNKAGGSSTRISMPPAVRNPGGSGVQPAQRPGSSPRNPVPPAGKPEGSLSSGKLQIPPAPEKGLGSSTRIQLPPAVRGAGVSSSKLGLSSEAANAVQEASRARAAARAASNPPPLRISWVWVVAGFLVLSGVMAFVFTRARSTPATVGQSKEENEAIARLRAGPRTSADLNTVQRLFFKIKDWNDVEGLLGDPDYVLKGTVPLWSPERGEYVLEGNEFRAYRVNDPNSQLPGGEESPVVSIMLFQLRDNSVIYLEPMRMYVVKELPEHWKTGKMSTPGAGINPSMKPTYDPAKAPPPMEMPPKPGTGGPNLGPTGMKPPVVTKTR